MILIGELSSFREIIVQVLTKLYVEDSANISMFVSLKVRKYSMDNVHTCLLYTSDAADEQYIV